MAKLKLQEKVYEHLEKLLEDEDFEAFFSGLLEIINRESKHLAMLISLLHDYENNNIRQAEFGSFKSQCGLLLARIFANDFRKMDEVSLRIDGKWYSTAEDMGTFAEKLLDKTVVKQISLNKHGFVEIIFLDNKKRIIGNKPFEMGVVRVYVRKELQKLTLPY